MSRNGQQKKCFDRKGICHLDFEKQPEKPPKVKSGRSSTIKAEKACQFKQRLRILLELPVADQQQKEILKNAGLPAQYQDHLQLVAWNLYQKALSGDMAAIRGAARHPRRGRAGGRKGPKAAGQSIQNGAGGYH